MRTGDGSPTIYQKDIDECYHSIHGALAESRHVFIECGLMYRLTYLNIALPGDIIKVFELGFGTGLNAALTAMKPYKVHYTAIEKYPLDFNLVHRLEFGENVDTELFRKLHSSSWEDFVTINDNFSLKKLTGDFLDFKTDELFDIIYMDAFSPEKQPELWSDKSISKLSGMLAPGGILTTYCAKGSIRRLFESFGLEAQRLPGPPNGKREILRLIKPL